MPVPEPNVLYAAELSFMFFFIRLVVEYQEGSEWKAYSAASCSDVLSRAQVKLSGDYFSTAGKPSYTLDLCAMVQVNDATQFERKVRNRARRDADEKLHKIVASVLMARSAAVEAASLPSSAPEADAWESFVDGKWLPYHPSTVADLRTKSVFELKVGSTRYLIDLAQLKQTNCATKTERPIRFQLSSDSKQ